MPNKVRRLVKLVLAEGFEPPTYGLQNRCTTAVLSQPDFQGAQYKRLLPSFQRGPGGEALQHEIGCCLPAAGEMRQQAPGIAAAEVFGARVLASQAL